MAKLGRETPDVPCTLFFEEHEWRAPVTFYDRVPVAPEATPPTLRDATRMVAGLGGFLGRNGEGDPRTETLWREIQRLDDLAVMWTIFTNLQRCPSTPGPSRRKYGERSGIDSWAAVMLQREILEHLCSWRTTMKKVKNSIGRNPFRLIPFSSMLFLSCRLPPAEVEVAGEGARRPPP